MMLNTDILQVYNCSPNCDCIYVKSHVELVCRAVYLSNSCTVITTLLLLLHISEAPVFNKYLIIMRYHWFSVLFYNLSVEREKNSIRRLHYTYCDECFFFRF